MFWISGIVQRMTAFTVRKMQEIFFTSTKKCSHYHLCGNNRSLSCIFPSSIENVLLKKLFTVLSILLKTKPNQTHVEDVIDGSSIYRQL